MGLCTSRHKKSYAWEKDPKTFVQKMKILQQDVNEMLKRREEDSEAYERELMLFAFKEAEWKRERKKLREEVKQLRNKLHEREEKIRLMEEEVDQITIGKNAQFEGKSVGSSTATASATVTSDSTTLTLMEQMREERARRDETVEKWKMLYLAIKNELDDLIQKTHQGAFCWRADEDLMEEMQRELKTKDEIIEVLKAQLGSMENEEFKRRREMDILKQSLRIVSNKKAATSTKHVKNSKPSIRLKKSLSKLALVNYN